ncbi:alpha/beta hydrolase [Salinicola halimionae]|uniref:alpha/beta hydrolase n=1 Tax=Salinicola halimionae TaxID=1949081 RepID=UPI000DA20FAF|nr:alpha/beta hydrolase [Salinicola halimionae]
MKRPVVFIHDVGQTPACWKPFISRYGACDYLCQAPAWPWLPTMPDTAASNTLWSGLSIKSVVDHYADWIDSMSFPPLLVGHGFGGLFVQLLLDRGLGTAGIALCPVPRRGHWASLISLPPPASAPGSTHVLPRSVAMPRRLLLEAALGIGTAIDYANDDRGPLLLISAGKSRRVSSANVAACYRRHRRSMAITTLHAFPHHSDELIVESGWEAVADATLDWAQNPE